MFRALAALLAAMAAAELAWAMYLSGVGAKAMRLKRTPVSRWAGLSSSIAAYSVIWRSPPSAATRASGVYPIHIDDALDAQLLVDDIREGRVRVLHAHDAAMRIKGTRLTADHGVTIECFLDNLDTKFGASTSVAPIAATLSTSTWPARATFFGS